MPPSTQPEAIEREEVMSETGLPGEKVMKFEALTEVRNKEQEQYAYELTSI